MHKEERKLVTKTGLHNVIKIGVDDVLYETGRGRYED